MKAVFLAIGMALMGAPAVAASEATDPARSVREIADVIEESFFDAGVGRDVAAGLRSDAAAGTFSSYSDEALAKELTSRLKKVDGHFRVGAPVAAGAQANPSPSIEYEDQVRRINFGFRSVEILPGNVGYIDLRFFADFDSVDALERLAADAALQMIAHTDAVIIDLRDNGGGSPPMAAYLASAFLPPHSRAYMAEHYRSGEVISQTPETPVDPERRRLNTPLIVMISARSASAAEALAYTLQSVQRAVVVGQPSMGAASMARPVATPSGFVVFAPYASTLSPLTNANWEGTGVIPDVAGPVADAKNHAHQMALRMATERLTRAAMITENRWILEALEKPAAEVALDDYARLYGEVAVSVSGAGLSYRQGARPPLMLQPLETDLFTVVDEPTQRVRFKRDGSGRVSGLNRLWSEGTVEPTLAREVAPVH